MGKIIFFSFIGLFTIFGNAFASQNVTLVKNNITYIVAISGKNSDHLTVTSEGKSYDIDAFKTLPLPYIGEAKIRHLSIDENGDVAITYGKHNYAKLDPATKKLNFVGAD